MKTLFRESFWRDVKKIKDEKTRALVEEVIAEAQDAAGISGIGNVKKCAVEPMRIAFALAAIALGSLSRKILWSSCAVFYARTCIDTFPEPG